jgi:hypothetical protein
MNKKIEFFYSFYKSVYQNNSKAIQFMNDAIEKYGKEKAVLLLSKSNSVVTTPVVVPNNIQYPDIRPPGASVGGLTRTYTSLSSGGTTGTTQNGFTTYISTQDIGNKAGKPFDNIYISFEITSNYFSNAASFPAFYIGISKGSIPSLVTANTSTILSNLVNSRPFIFFNYWGNYFYNTSTQTGVISSVNVPTDYPTNPFRIYIQLVRTTGVFSIGMSKTNLVNISQPVGNVFNWNDTVFLHLHFYSQTTNVLSPQTYTVTMIEW